jgi:hypothetical protein
MKLILPFATAVLLVGSATAQQMIQVPSSLDQTLVPGAAVTSAPMVGARATAACDDFNRATLGTDWVSINGSPGIFGDMFGSGSGNSHAQHATASVNYDAAVISFDLPDAPSQLTYGAASHGLGGSQNLYTKVQCQSPYGAYNFLGFYVGNGSPGGYSGSGFFALTTPVVGGLVTVYIDPNSGGDVVVIDIDEDRDGNVDYTYTAAGVNGISGQFGTGIGLGAFSSSFGSLDDFELNGGCAPVGPQLAATGTAGGTMTFDFSGFTPNGGIAVVYGPAGSLTGAAPCGSVTVDLTPINFPPPSQLILLTADANGDAQLVQGVPGPAVGLRVQAVDLTACTVSNFITIN